jgi:membrane associated rhomboid family serine protease
VATCYRHPGRETNVSCSNCGRPICPDCMTSTSVGMRCPECAGERTRVNRGAAGGIATGAAPATYALIAINVVAFAAEMFGGGGATSLEGGGDLIRDAALNGPQVDSGEWWRIITGGFLHAGPLHLLLNMFALYILGNLLEPAIGTPRFVAIYFVSLLAGACGAMLVEPDQNTVGASGAIFGLLAAAFVVARARRLEGLATEIGIFVVINLVFTFSIPNISIGGHIGGLIGGALAALAVSYAERRPTRSNHLLELGALVAVGVISVAVALWAAGEPNAVIG